MFVFRLGDERQVEKIPVSIVLRTATPWNRPTGSRAGDQIVDAGQSGLKDGAKVRLPGDPDPEEDSEEDQNENDEDNEDNVETEETD